MFRPGVRWCDCRGTTLFVHVINSRLDWYHCHWIRYKTGILVEVETFSQQGHVPISVGFVFRLLADSHDIPCNAVSKEPVSPRHASGYSHCKRISRVTCMNCFIRWDSACRYNFLMFHITRRGAFTSRSEGWVPNVDISRRFVVPSDN